VTDTIFKAVPLITKDQAHHLDITVKDGTGAVVWLDLGAGSSTAVGNARIYLDHDKDTWMTDFVIVEPHNTAATIGSCVAEVYISTDYMNVRHCNGILLIPKDMFTKDKFVIKNFATNLNEGCDCGALHTSMPDHHSDWCNLVGNKTRTIANRRDQS